MQREDIKKERSELDTIDVAKDFFRGFCVCRIEYTSIDSGIKSNLELVDCIVNYGDNVIASFK